MATAVSPYYEWRPYEADTIAASTRLVAPPGLGGFNQIIVRVVTTGVSGGSDAIDFDLDTSFTRLGDGSDEWVEIISMTQATGATTETKYYLRSATQGWADRISLEVTVAAGATATGVSVTVVGANA